MTTRISTKTSDRSTSLLDPLRLLDHLKASIRGHTPTVTALAKNESEPFAVLVATILSLRTRDSVTEKASKRLLLRFPTARALMQAPAEEVERLIFPAGFYRTKAANLIRISRILWDERGGRVPSEMEALLALPGVGRKTAQLVRAEGFGIPAICVDVHVHRIANRTGLCSSSSPDRTEECLSKSFPQRKWNEINRVFVAFGQSTCTPVSPKCSTCPLSGVCPKNGVTKQR